MKPASWMDHLPPWLAWGAIASTGYFEPGELAAMALPLLAALLVQAAGWPTARWQRALELLAVAAALGLAALRVGMLLLVVGMLFLLCGARLCLPRGPAQRRQLLLMGFLLFLTTSVTTSQLDFLVWSVAWVAGAALVLLRQAWEPSAALRRGPPPSPPYALVLPWGAGVLALAAGLFVVLPRLPAAARRLPMGVRSLGGLRAGLSDVLDLGGIGPIQDNREVALRIQPADPGDAAGVAGARQAMGLLRGYLLEDLDGQRWVTSPETPGPSGIRWAENGTGAAPVTADFFFGPALLGTLPLPYGRVQVAALGGEPLRTGPGGSVRWAYPVRRTTALRVALAPEDLEPAPPPRGRRLALLTATGDGGDSARAWSLMAAPAPVPARELARTLTGALRSRCTYTLANPSGGAANPLEDFLERSHAGHCEYFASALALMLRYRGVPARVATGYRLGPWIEEGGYFLVTESEAHSWVEYYDAEAGGWRVADPSPAPPPAPFGAAPLAAAWGRWVDALRFHWDRRVVRFSDDDQVAGFDWAVRALGALGRWRPGPGARAAAAAALLGLLAGAAWLGFRRRGGPQGLWPRLAADGPERVPELDPLVRRARRFLPPGEAETARAWLGRLARQRPHRAGDLRRLAREVDAVAYGGHSRKRLRDLARDEARHWKR